ncbi:MAG TPA: YicC family protein, partial [Desulfocapsa sulfexigens]|nr:YicC family protein [Desulfocapsa sulfexigens]
MTSKSMTGFGRGEAEAGGRQWVAEIRCVNHRYLDLKIKLPRGYAGLE